jgi:hypothetical protein
MAINLNQDLGAILKDLMGNKRSSGAAASANVSSSEDLLSKIMPFSYAIILLLIISLASFAYYKYYYSLKTAENAKKYAEVKRLNDLKVETENLEKKITVLKNKLHDSRELFIDKLSHFGNSGDLGELYHSVSVLATKYNLSILNIEEIEAKAKESEEDPKSSKKGKKKEEAPAKVEKNDQPKVAEVGVALEIKGSYSDYILFKEDLAVAEMLLKIDAENIKVKENEVGIIFATLNLTTYAINKTPFQNALGVNDKKEDADVKK